MTLSALGWKIGLTDSEIDLFDATCINFSIPSTKKEVTALVFQKPYHKTKASCF